MTVKLNYTEKHNHYELKHRIVKVEYTKKTIVLWMAVLAERCCTPRPLVAV